jgi:hypothetical protein
LEEIIAKTRMQQAQAAIKMIVKIVPKIVKIMAK